MTKLESFSIPDQKGSLRNTFIETMQWQADEEDSLQVFEICFPP